MNLFKKLLLLIISISILIGLIILRKHFKDQGYFDSFLTACILTLIFSTLLGVATQAIKYFTRRKSNNKNHN